AMSRRSSTAPRKRAAQPQNGGRRPMPERPTNLRKRSWFGVLGRTVREFRADNLTDWAAALTYYGVQALFPALIVLVSIVGLVGPSATQPLVSNIGKLAPGPAAAIVSGAVKQIANNRSAAGLAFIVGIAAAVWSASGYGGA